MKDKVKSSINDKSAKKAAERNPAAGAAKENTESNEAVSAFRKKLGGGCM